MAALDQSELPNDPVTSNDAILQAFVLPTPTDFGAWTSLIEKIEKALVVDVEKICLVYDSFLSLFPLCYGYWKKYANHMATLRSVDKVVEVYERAVQYSTYSVHLWVDYCTFGTLLFEDPMDVRRLFERGISFVGKDYLCHLLWDKYIEYEYTQKQWSSLAHIFIRSLKYPTKKLNSYYDSFKKLVTIWEEEIEFEGAVVMEGQSDTDFNITDIAAFEDVDIPGVIRDLLDPTVGLRRRNALEKYFSIGAKLFQEASQIDAEIHCFESCIRRPYFHVKPLDVSQLENWHNYLDFVEMQGDFDWTVKLYERCLITCANYPEFWMRYVEFMESKGGREIANFALVRATEIFLKGVPAIHLFCANFKEKIGDALGAHASFRKCSSELDSDFIKKVKREANMENRLGNADAAFGIYEKALEMAKEKQKSLTLSILFVQFCKFKYMATGSIDAARDIIIQGIQYLPNCKLLLEGLMNFEMMHRGPWQINVVDSVVAHAVSPEPNVSQELNIKDREDISSLYLEFVEQCGTIDDIRKAWKRHRKLFPHIMRHIPYNSSTQSQDMLITLPSHGPEDKVSDGSVQYLMLDHRKVASPERPEIHSDHAVTIESQSEGIGNTKEASPSLASSEVFEHSGQNVTRQNLGDNENDIANHCEAQQPSQQFVEGANEVQKDPDYEPSNDMKQPSLEKLSLNPLDDEIRDSNLSMSQDNEAPRATPRSHGSEPQDGGYTSSICCSSSPTYKQSGDSTQVYVEADFGRLHAAVDSSFQQTQPRLQQLVPRSTPSDPCAVGGQGDQMNCTEESLGDASSGFRGYPQTQQPQQWQISPQQQHHQPSVKQEILVHQGYPCQPQFGQNTQIQPGHVFPAENMHPQSFASAPQPPPQAEPQPVSFSQAQVYPYPVQSNEFYGHMQNSQAYINHLWHYYYMQQQQQQQMQQPHQMQEQQQLLVLQQQQPQSQMQGQQIPPLRIQTWSSSYYQQELLNRVEASLWKLKADPLMPGLANWVFFGNLCPRLSQSINPA